jgi:SAM-dependent methyltransferase
MDDLQHLKDQARFVWAQGDYSEVARYLLPAAAHLVDSSGIGPGTTVLDVGAGDGNTAITAAEKGARVIATDLTPEMVERGRRRTSQAGLDIEWQEADVEDLPFEDGRFDVVASSFAAIFAPRADVATGELMRVARPGGLIAITTWSRTGYVGESFALGARHRPPPEPGTDSPESWGDQDTIRARFGPHASDIEIKTGHIHWRFDSVAQWSEWSVLNAPPMIVAKKMMPPDQFAEMREEFAQLAERYNEATDGTMDVRAEYLLILARKPAANGRP